VETRYLDRPEGRIAYDDTGSGRRLVVCVPSMGDLRSEYRFLKPALARAGFRVITMDVRGHGDSTTGWSDHSAAAVGSDIVALVRQLGGVPAAVIGDSMAAASAVWAAAEAPDLVEDIVLLGPVVRDLPASFVQKIMARLALIGPWKVKVWSAFYKTLYPTSPPDDLAEYRSALEDNLREPGRFDSLKAMIAAPKADCEARIPDVRARALVVMGSRDPDFKDPKAEATLLAERLSGELEMIEDAGHYPHAEMPEQTARVIVEHLNKAASAA